MQSLAPLIAALQGDWREALVDRLCLLGAAKFDTSDPSLSIEEVNRRVNYPRRYAVALVSPALVLLVGVVFHYSLIRTPAPPLEPPADLAIVDWWSLVDGLYFSIISMTTIGYGDICPESPTSRLVACAYLPLAVISLADCISDIAMIRARKEIRETDYMRIIDECLLRDAFRGFAPDRPGDPNFDPRLTEAEFLVDTLLEHGLVDQAAVVAISRHFRQLTRRSADRSAKDDRALTLRVVYESLRYRAAAGLPLSAGAKAMDLNADGQFKWQSFEEWKTKSWRPRLQSKAEVLRRRGPKGSWVPIDFGGSKGASCAHSVVRASVNASKKRATQATCRRVGE